MIPWIPRMQVSEFFFLRHNDYPVIHLFSLLQLIIWGQNTFDTAFKGRDFANLLRTLCMFVCVFVFVCAPKKLKKGKKHLNR